MSRLNIKALGIAMVMTVVIIFVLGVSLPAQSTLVRSGYGTTTTTSTYLCSLSWQESGRVELGDLDPASCGEGECVTQTFSSENGDTKVTVTITISVSDPGSYKMVIVWSKKVCA